MIITLLIIALTAAVTIYLSLKKSLKCPNCKSKNATLTGEKKYKENPAIALWGSPDSYYELEYHCKNCGNVFWYKKKAIIFN